MKQKMRIGFGIAALALMSCGETDDNELGAQVLGLLFDAEQAPVSQVPTVSEADILASSGQFIRVNIRELERLDTMVAVGENGPRTTWMDSANISLTLEDGIVVATRGLRRDLMGAEVLQTWAAIRAGGGDSTRQHDFMSDQDQITTSVLQCSIALQGTEDVTRFGQTRVATKFEERCTSDGLSFVNIYWVSGQGTLLRSLQAVSPDAGYLQIDVF